MTIAKAAALIVAFVGGVALGVAIGPSIRHTPSVPGPFMDGQFAPGVEEPSAPETRPQAMASHPRSITNGHAAAKPMMAASEPKIQERLKPVLSRGTRVAMAADGFASAEQFATVAHAAHNTSVPFVVLKHRILEEGRTLTEAIHESKPALDAKSEVTRARQEAKSDLEAIAG